jgi:hypothetical protein
LTNCLTFAIDCVLNFLKHLFGALWINFCFLLDNCFHYSYCCLSIWSSCFFLFLSFFGNSFHDIGSQLCVTLFFGFICFLNNSFESSFN